MTNAEIEAVIAEFAPDEALSPSEPKESIKFLQYEDGSKTEVSAKDAIRICDEINDTTKHKVKVV